MALLVSRASRIFPVGGASGENPRSLQNRVCSWHYMLHISRFLPHKWMELTFLMGGVQNTLRTIHSSLRLSWEEKPKRSVSLSCVLSTLSTLAMKRQCLSCEPQDRSSSAPFAVWLVRFQVCYYMTLYTFLQLSTVCNSRIYVTMNVFS